MRILRGTIFGGIFYFLAGWLIYGILLMDFFMAATNHCANRPEGEMIWWAMIISNLAATLLLTLVLNWSRAESIIDGLKIGAVFGALFTTVYDFSLWSMTTMYQNLGTIFAEIGTSAILFALVGAVIVLTWGREGNK